LQEISHSWDILAMDLREFFLPLPASEREAFAKRCDTTVKHLLNIVCGDRKCSPELAINIERETKGRLRVEATAPRAKNKRVDWAYIRGTRRAVSRIAS
jgi:DNA-binding transcriptional regulator YdaS (Cro superfamily)